MIILDLIFTIIAFIIDAVLFVIKAIPWLIGIAVVAFLVSYTFGAIVTWNEKRKNRE